MIVFSHSGNCLFLALLGYKSFLTESENGAFLDGKLIPLGRRNLHFDRPSQELLPHPYRQELFFTSSPVDFGPLVILRYLIKTHGETDTIG